MKIQPAIFLVLFLCAAGGADAADGPLSDSSSPDPVLPDPVPGRGTYFSPKTATALTAYPDTGVARTDKHINPGCSAISPCAQPVPSFRTIAASAKPKKAGAGSDPAPAQ